MPRRARLTLPNLRCTSFSAATIARRASSQARITNGIYGGWASMPGKPGAVCLTQENAYLFTCQRYIELNPVRADMVSHPADYRWSSYRANAQGEADPVVTPHPLYTALGADASARLAAYRELFRYELEPGLVDEIRRATNALPRRCHRS